MIAHIGINCGTWGIFPNNFIGAPNLTLDQNLHNFSFPEPYGRSAAKGDPLLYPRDHSLGPVL